MAQFHMHIKVIGGGRSAVAASAYRSGEKLKDRETGKTHDYTHKQGVAYTRILLPENAPAEFADRETLWNKVEEAEKKNPNAQYARELEASFPKELTLDQCKEIAETYCRENFQEKGMCVDYAIEMKEGNPHIHIMTTLRELDKDGNFMNKSKEVFANDRDENGKPIYNPEKPCYDPKNKAETEQYRIPKLDENGQQKVRERKGKGTEKLWEKVKLDTNDWNSRENATQWRESWAKECNKYLSKENQIDHRSYRERGIERGATIHEGYAARQMEARGKTSDRCEINRRIRALNKELEQIHAQEKALDRGHTMSQGAKSRLADILNEPTASLSNSGAAPDNFKGNWEWLTQAERDEIMYRQSLRDDEMSETGTSSFMKDYKPQITPQQAEEFSFASIFSKEGKDDERGRGNDDRGRGRTDRANDSRSTGFERTSNRAIIGTQKVVSGHNQGEGREDLDAFLRGINAKVRNAEVSRENRIAEQSRLSAERERLAKGRDKKAKGKQREDTGFARTR